MTLRNQNPLTLRPLTVTDSIDGTNGAPGSMQLMSNLVPSMHTKGVWVPRPASVKLFDLANVSNVEYMVEIGDRLYGIGVSNRFTGKSEPFIYDLANRVEVPVSCVYADNLPNAAPATGDWQPPTITQVGSYILFSHPGFTLPNAFGWLDMTGLVDSASGSTGYTNVPTLWNGSTWGGGFWNGPVATGGKVVAGLSKNVLLAGWRAGMAIHDSAQNIPSGTTIASIASDGLSLTLSQPTVGASSPDTITVNGGTPAYPLWAAGNMSISPLIKPATAISLFNGRAEYAVDNATVFSEAGDPLIPPPSTISNVLTIQNGLKITAMTTIPFANSTVAGGVVQALLLWQGDAAIWQVTGDPTTSNLALNFFSSIGTDAPLTIQTAPQGIIYVAPDGVRLIQLDGTVSDPIGANGDGVALPFINVTYPSRMVAAYNEDVYRVSVTSYSSFGGSAIAPIVSAEYWFHNKLKAWSGPHSFPASAITPSDRPSTNHGYLMQPINASGIWFSNTRPLVDSGYLENGQTLSWSYQTTLFPDNGLMCENAMVESAIAIALPQTGSATVAMLDEAGTQLDQVTVNGFVPQTPTPRTPGTLWDGSTWNGGFWGPGTAGALLTQRDLPWHQTLVFKQGSIVVAGFSDPAVAVGNLYLRYQRTGYMNQDLSVIT